MGNFVKVSSGRSFLAGYHIFWWKDFHMLVVTHYMYSYKFSSFPFFNCMLSWDGCLQRSSNCHVKIFFPICCYYVSCFDQNSKITSMFYFYIMLLCNNLWIKQTDILKQQAVSILPLGGSQTICYFL